MYYLLEGKLPKKVSIDQWARTFNPIHVGDDTIDGVRISTVFLGIDHGHYRDSDEPAILFETMIFGGLLDETQRRYCTWEEAEAGHKERIEKVQKNLKPKPPNEGIWNY